MGTWRIGQGASQELRLVAEGFQFAEGPLWEAGRNRLIFSDIPRSAVYAWDERRGTTVFRTGSNKTNGQTMDSRGRLIRCEHLTSRLVRDEEDGSVTVLASHVGGEELNSPNDVVFDSAGGLWFTDPPFGRTQAHVGLVRPVPQPASVYRVRPDSREVTRMCSDFAGCNGLCFSPDETTLYVNDSVTRSIRRFSVVGDGVEGGETIAVMPSEGGPPDGMKADVDGRLYSSGPGGIWVFRSDGTQVDFLPVPQVVGNLAWGGPGWRTLFITASTAVYACQTEVPGVVPAAG